MSNPESPAQLGTRPAGPELSRASAASGRPSEAIGSSSVWREGLFWLALVLSLGRFWQLSQWSLWEDEVFTLNDSRALLAGEWSKNPLGFAPFAALIKFLGPVPSEAALRMIPALLGCVGIAAIGVLFAPVYGARRAAAAALLVSASSWHLYWSQNARAYTLTQDLVLIGGALALSAIFAATSARRARHVWAAVLFGMLASLVHPSAALFCLGFVGALFLLPLVGFSGALRPLPPLPRNVLRIGVLIGAIAALWLGRLWWDYYRAKSDSTALHLLMTSGWYFTPALLAAAAFGAIGAWRQRSARDVIVAMSCLLAAGLAVANALFVRAAAQYLFVLLPFVALLATRPLVQRNASPRWRAAWLLALVLPALADQGLYFFQRNGDRPPWKEGFEQVINARLPGDLVFTNCANVGEFYFEPRSLNLRRPVHVQNLDRYSSATELHWARQARRAWFVINLERLTEWDLDAQRSFKTMLKEDATLVANFQVGEGLRDLDVLVYLRE